jgi:glucose-1-phosphate cytidylyltransferase
MKAVILAGGRGTRLSEETDLKPKPMSEIGGMPILWHIMKIYSNYGIKDFIILAGYKSYFIKEFFQNYHLYMNSIEFDLSRGTRNIIGKINTKWNVKVVDTGLDTLTGGRLLRAKKIIGEDDFFLTYGDCLGDINIKKLFQFHKKHKKIATLTGIVQPGRYGSLSLDNNKIKSFSEKPLQKNNLINGGFFVFKNKIFKYLKDDQTILERRPLSKLSSEGNLFCYKHNGFWHPMDTLKDKRTLDLLWSSNKAPWKKLIS